jgi:hypothetical protein
MGIPVKFFEKDGKCSKLSILPTAFAISNPPTPPAGFDSTTTYKVHFLYINNGSEQGMITQRIGRIYVAKPDDRSAQEEILKNFEKDWNNAPPNTGPSVALPGQQGFGPKPYPFLRRTRKI